MAALLERIRICTSVRIVEWAEFMYLTFVI